MENPNLVFLFAHILVTFGLSIAHEQLCSNKGTYSVNSTYSNNVDLIISSLRSNITVYGGFYNGTVGQDLDEVYAMALCRGDLSSDTCYNCINSASQGIRKQCPYQKEAIMWDGACMVRYANRDFFAKMETIPPLCNSNPNNVSGNVHKFNETLYHLMEKLAIEASSGSSGLKFATGHESSTSSLYGLAQCTPDISQTDCRICLQQALKELDRCAGGTKGGRLFLPSCIVWFEVYRFYDSADTFRGSSPSPPPPRRANISPPPPPPTDPANISTPILADYPPGPANISPLTLIDYPPGPANVSPLRATNMKGTEIKKSQIILTIGGSPPSPPPPRRANISPPPPPPTHPTNISPPALSDYPPCPAYISPPPPPPRDPVNISPPPPPPRDPVNISPPPPPLRDPANISPPTIIDNPPGPANFSPPRATNIKGTKIKKSQIILIIVVLVAILTLVAVTCAIFKKRSLKQRLEDDDDDAIKRLESLQFNFSTLKIATNDFCDDNKLGQGGFGSVYKGVLSNAQEIAVKRLSGYSAQGETEFKNEILLMAKLQHRNLVSLVGFCSEGTERILVYEYLGKGSLDYFIFDPIKCSQLNWETRLKIINGIAKGILYLHEDSRLKIIHCDLKASNVLLDEEMNPKISDFGMARLFRLDQTQDITSRVAGTFGYMAPEYAFGNRFSVKSDIFSLGVLILEIVSGKKNSWLLDSEEVMHLPSHAWRNWREGTASILFDTALTGSRESEIMRCIHIGLLCVQENASDRPTMASVVLMLSSHSWSLPSPSRPAYFGYIDANTDTDVPSLESTAQEQSRENTVGTTCLSGN